MIIRLIAALTLCVALAACTGTNPPAADPGAVTRAAYVHDGPPMLTLYTVRATRSDGGAHTGLMVNGSQRVLWDPAGSFVHPDVPEVADVKYGLSPLIERVYIDYHVRPTHYMIVQEMPVSAETAERVLALVRGQGTASRSTCARTTSTILREAGIDVGVTWFPNALSDDFGALPGVTTRRVDMTNVDTNHNVVFGEGGVPTPPGT